MDDRELSLLQKQRRALALGQEYLGVENGHIQRRLADEQVDEVVVSVGDSPELLPQGTLLDRETTYCRRTVDSHSPVALSNVPEQGWGDDPAYEEHDFDCYLGTTIFVGGEVYGTVCFLSKRAREADFTPEEKAFIELLARVLGREIERSEYERQLGETKQVRQRSERKYEGILQLAPDAFFLADAESGAIVEVNEEAVELTGYTASELQGMSVLDLPPDEQRQRYKRLFETSLDGTTRREFDDGTPLTLALADGSHVPIEMSFRTVEIDGRQLAQGIVRDISTQRERERELERTREFFQQTQEAVGLGGWEVDLGSYSLRWTDEIYRIFDLPVDEDITVEESMEFYHPEDRQTLKDAFERLVDEGERYDLELRIVTASDETRWVRTIGEPQYGDEGEDVIAARGVFQDITERKERERDLRLRNQAIEESSIGVTIGDATKPDIPITYANEGFTKLTGYRKEEVLGSNCRFLQGEETDDATVAKIRDAIEAERPIRTEILNYRADGSPFWNRLTVSPVAGADGERVTHFVGIQEDVTAQKRRERLFDVLNRVLRHNLRNDMSVISGFANVIAEQSEGEISRMARRIEGTADDLTSLSEKAQSLQISVCDEESFEPRDVAADVRTVGASLRTEYPDVEFSIDVDDHDEVMASEQLVLALRELGENAAKHGQSAVGFRVESTSGGEVAVHVADSGPGLPASEREVLEKGQETPLVHGSGLGLWLVNWIVTGLGGNVTTAVDEGTTVTVRFPPASRELEHHHRIASQDGAFTDSGR